MSKIRYQGETRVRVSTTGPLTPRIVFVINTCTIRVTPVSLIWQVFFYDQPKKPYENRNKPMRELSFLTALRQPKTLQIRRKKHGNSQASL